MLDAEEIFFFQQALTTSCFAAKLSGMSMENKTSQPEYAFGTQPNDFSVEATQ